MRLQPGWQHHHAVRLPRLRPRLWVRPWGGTRPDPTPTNARPHPDPDPTQAQATALPPARLEEGRSAPRPSVAARLVVAARVGGPERL